jgi:hypothetical protein
MVLFSSHAPAAATGASSIGTVDRVILNWARVCSEAVAARTEIDVLG